MGPTLLVDKSSVEMLSIDESVWLDQFFMGNVCPILYSETLADLTKSRSGGRSNPVAARALVSEIAAKTPLGGAANMHHRQLVAQDMLGNHPTMDGRPVVAAGKIKKEPSGKTGMDFGEFSEAKALQRWQNEEFEEMEEEFAIAWRKDLDTTSYDHFFAIIKNVIPTGKNLSSLELIKEHVDNFVANSDEKIIYLMFELFGIKPELYKSFVEAFRKSGGKSITELCPYASYVLRVDLFFYIAMLKGFISSDRASNKLDIAYLYYLPFCEAFTSNDRLHARVAPLFCEQGQVFIKGEDLKSACKDMVEYYSQFEDQIEARGIINFVGEPPYTIDNAITKTWDKSFGTDWRKPTGDVPPGTRPASSEDSQSGVNIQDITGAKEVTRPTGRETIDFLTITRKIRARHGSYRMLSQDVVDGAGK